ncbi:oxidoreductase [Sphingomonas morindae]|uniref:Oxidoreductase n=1 Tax=Sphingomonas morindae TaxID=1541170 RepID=A0ABY4X6N1_9SPHN|nr:oxidoreductase [Sphingomonas morindae]USI72556.1 oxidoreductase [Sphingomonas morindae]
MDANTEYRLGDRMVRRIGFGAMQLAGPGVFGPPADRAASLAVLRAALAAGVDHIDTADLYGPRIVNELIREALAPYPAGLTIVSKVGARRGPAGEWIEDKAPEALRRQVADTCAALGVDRLDIVNMRFWGDGHGAAEGPVEAEIAVLAALQAEGVIGHIGVSNVTAAQVAAARRVAPIICVQNQYNLAHRGDDALIDALAAEGIAYVPFFPLGGFTPLQSAALETVAARLGATPMQVALAWLLQRSPNILLIPGTRSTAHLAENMAAGAIILDEAARAALDGIAATPPAHS